MALTELALHGTPALALQAADGARVLVTLHGGHVVSWTPAGVHDDQLYLSPRSGFGPGQAIRGGVPVVFPQFSDRGPLPRHGFVRNRAWQLLRCGDDADGAATAVLGLVDDAATRAIWPHAFALELRLRLSGPQLDMTLHVTNTGSVPWQCAAALHTYLQVSDSARARIAGLAGRPYHDAVDGQARIQHETLLHLPGEVDRVYAGVDGGIELSADGDAPACCLQVSHAGFADVVVWNPGPARCAALPDMPPDGYRHMVCIESARIAQPVVLAPGQSWSGTQQLRRLAADGSPAAG
ncbi:D-hexose-6-phosphate mutarotase [Comamonadaceae bacterium G21597-S1]|nr:D-hexose-6-phosphate mutarotase [Comamonadaceae bacterium G21597-S1]